MAPTDSTPNHVHVESNNNEDTSPVTKPVINETYAELLSRKSSKDIFLDFAVVYLCVPFWITLFASILLWFHDTYHYHFNWQRDVDLLIFPLIFVLTALPLTYFRFQASNPSHFLHHLRVETTEKFLIETRQNLPSLLKLDIIVNIAFLTFMNLSGIFHAQSWSELNYFDLYVQALILLFLFDTGTYFGHRIGHKPRYYPYHKTHHNVRNTVALSLIDIDMADFFINNLPLMILPFLFALSGHRMCYEVWIVGFAFMFAQGFIIHSDLYLVSARNSLGLYWGDTVISHSLHHSRNKGYYSFVAPQIWDWVCDTQGN